MSSPVIAREFMRLGAEVYSVMTKSACELISPDLMYWATGNHVITHLTGGVEHIALAGDRPRGHGVADLILVCPATANTISKIACGIDDTPVTTVVTTAFGSGVPIVVVPAMHESMYNHPILTENMNKLRRFGAEVLGPRIDEGKAKIAHIDDIVSRVCDILVSKKDMKGMRVLITAGPTREFIDEVRYLSNPSSGRMGFALAEEVLARGGQATIIRGRGSTAKPPKSAKIIDAGSTKDMADVTVNELTTEKYHCFISAAAISDYAPIQKRAEKISSDNPTLKIDLVATPKILRMARKTADESRQNKDLFIVGFKAETKIPKEQIIDRAYSRMMDSNLDLMVANDVGQEGAGFESSQNEVYIVDRNKIVVHVPLKTKRYVASQIVDLILEKMREKKA
ncbi:MAG: phosphopantothenoylcysteine decarboxylase [Promethearchaeota archaeon CR_4]|nr:MAG: phosphopantothenoylcysteine decarboxylase [Candidatus Lokiarchaeota archaeon CR_4]